MKMQLNLLLLFLVLFTVRTFGQKSTLTVAVNDLRNSDGFVLIQLVDKDELPIQQKKVTIIDGQIEIRFTNVPAGKYAISYFHDENKNSELDTGTMGIPKEGYGFSNDARGFMGPPGLKDQIFDLSSDTSMTLKTKYW